MLHAQKSKQNGAYREGSVKEVRRLGFEGGIELGWVTNGGGGEETF